MVFVTSRCGNDVSRDGRPLDHLLVSRPSRDGTLHDTHGRIVVLSSVVVAVLVDNNAF